MANPVDGTLITVAISGAVGYGIYRLTRPKHKPAGPLDLGRTCFAWMAIIVSFATLPPFFRHFDANSIATWVFGLVFYGGLAFGAGWLYGKLVKFGAANRQIEKDAAATPHLPPTLTAVVAPVMTNQAMPLQTLAVSGQTEQQGPNVKIKTEEDFYAEAYSELSGGERRVGLWAKVFSEARGNEAAAQAEYLRVRAQQLAESEEHSLTRREFERLRDFHVFHHLPGNGFIMVGPRGVFTVEIKFISKPARGEAKITFDGQQVLVGGFKPDRDCLVQARAQAGWLRNLIFESTGRKISVRPVVMYPGWFVDGPPSGVKSDVWILNPKALAAFIERERGSLTPEDVKLISFPLSRLGKL